MGSVDNFNLHDYHFKQDNNILISYKGPFEGQVLNVIGKYIKVALRDHPNASKKLYKIFVELSQNVSFYSDEKNIFTETKEAGIGTFIFYEQKDHFKIISGNMISRPVLDKVLEKVERINSLDNEGLREFKRQQLMQPSSEFGGGNIGLIKIALTSENPMSMQVHEISEEQIFMALTVKVNK